LRENDLLVSTVMQAISGQSGQSNHLAPTPRFNLPGAPHIQGVAEMQPLVFWSIGDQSGRPMNPAPAADIDGTSFIARR
jgi:hypothetical protein